MLEEKCQECGKTITRRMVANIVHGGVVCTACKHAIEHAKRAARPVPITTADVVYDPDEPTPRQIAFAQHLGIDIPPGVRKWDLSDLIDKALADKSARNYAAGPNDRTNPWLIAAVILLGLLIVLACAGLVSR